MPRRIELGSIASGLIGSFNSRNNDVGGYWGIGKLHKFVEQNVNKNILIEVITGAVLPETNEFNSLITFYRKKLNSHLKALNIPKEWVASVEFSATFEVEYEAKHHYWRSGLGKPYIVKCDITDDNGKHHVAIAYNNSRVDDPKREMKSCRASDF